MSDNRTEFKDAVSAAIVDNSNGDVTPQVVREVLQNNLANNIPFKDEVSTLAPRDPYIRISDGNITPASGEMSFRGDYAKLYINKISNAGVDLSNMLNLLGGGVVNMGYGNNSNSTKFKVSDVSLSGNVYILDGELLTTLGSIGIGSNYGLTFNVVSSAAAASGKGQALTYKLHSATDGTTTNAKTFSVESSIAPNVDEMTIHKVDQNSVSFDDVLKNAKAVVISDQNGNVIIYDVLSSTNKSSEVTFKVSTAGSIDFPDYVVDVNYYISVIGGRERPPFTFRYSDTAPVGDDEFNKDGFWIDVSVVNNGTDLTAFYGSLVKCSVIVHNLSEPDAFAVYKGTSFSTDVDKCRISATELYNNLTYTDGEEYQVLIISTGQDKISDIGNVSDNSGLKGKIIISEDGVDYERFALGSAVSKFGVDGPMGFEAMPVTGTIPTYGSFRTDFLSLALITKIRVSYKDLYGYFVNAYLTTLQAKALTIKNINTGAYAMYSISSKTDVPGDEYVEFDVSKILGGTEDISSASTYLLGFNI